jgi:glyoxylase-like metal-dependent hydrolase (beta-lactamase superfamily II)
VQELKSAAVVTAEFSEPQLTYELQDRQILNLGEMRAEIHHAPGHTPGSIVVTINSEVAITGDVLFKGSIGRTDLPRGSLSDMERSLREKIATLAEELEVLPGHGERTTIREELRSNSFLKAALQGKLEG